MEGEQLSSLKGKTLLITGGTGSFGRAVLEYLLDKKLKEIRVFSRDELKQEQMRRHIGNPIVKFYIGDVRSIESVDSAMRGVDFVFHAAALKQVPSCDFFPMEAVQTNVIGSQNVLQSATHHGVSRVICLSTDKAVYPINAMGMTKALMEKTALATARASVRNHPVITCVRYGNVMYSRGSVIPLFIEQIARKEAITITEPEMTRFMLPLRDAIELVMVAFKQGRSGDILVKKAPACTVSALADALRSLFRSNVPLKTIGIRHGEKLYETLVTREELRRADDLGKYYRIKMDGRDLNYGRYYTQGDVKEIELDDYTSHNTSRLSLPQVKQLLMTLPEIRRALATHKH